MKNPDFRFINLVLFALALGALGYWADMVAVS
jgi:hypothetical protein